VREAIEDFLRRSLPQIKGIGTYSSSRSNIYQHVEKLLRHAARATAARGRNRGIL